MSKIHRIAGLRISRVEPVIFSAADEEMWEPKDALPELEPPEDRLRRSKTHIFASDTISLTHSSAMEDVFAPKEREEHKDFTARATVYVMNMIVMVMALPVGLALLAFNILGGENLRTTAHVIALTGMATALAQTPGGMQLLSMF
ncbi:hypothetical protein GQ651_11115 [Alphaproteobacteria bacterium GH1-50]|uniref:Uncharacterized protein n=1 Tax=Kangsaoukella pontilimi TaxID=2691042 RepID=A0A7C9MGJ5_9RHOB|nr:hypothetical protein [Kangsaoukella pontilimi]MXQ08396.1 hypothetical protein [Kangsaoukella pontilimi]